MPPVRRSFFAQLAVVAVFGAACHHVDLTPRYGEGEIGIYDDLFSVSVVDEQNAVAVGYYTAIYVTNDGGQTWTTGEYVPASDDERKKYNRSSIYDVSMADAKRGWAVGQKGLVLHTSDGGLTWTRQENIKDINHQGTHLFSVHAVDANTAWAVGEWGTRLYTNDGGTTWQDLALTIDDKHPMFVWLAPVEQDKVRRGEMVYEDVGLNDVYCRRPPSRRCWIIGEFGYIFHSEDLGKNWTRGKITGDLNIEPIHVPYNTTEISEADRKMLAEFAQQIVGEQHLNIEIEAVANAKEVRVFGKEDDPFEFFEILDARALNVRSVLEEAGILSDRLRLRGSPPWDYEDFLEEDPGFLRRYLDGRAQEQPGIQVRVAQNPYLFNIHFKDDSNGLIAGLGGVLLRSQDGGMTWRYEKTGEKRAQFAVRDLDGIDITVGEKGLIRVSTDDGTTWTRPDKGFPPEVFTFMRTIDFSPSNGVGMIVGQAGLVLRTKDGGKTWEQVLPPESRRLSG